MKLLRYGPIGREKPGLLDAQGAIRDLSGIVLDITGAALGRASLQKLRGIDPKSLPKVEGNPRLGPCVGAVGNFVAVGLNYVDHAKETGATIPTEPILFNKHTCSICGPNDDVMLPKGSKKLDWEAEIAFVMGESAYHVSEDKALDYVAGVAVCHDVSEREFQIERGGQWTKGKSAPTLGPLGPWLVTLDEVKDPQKLRVTLDLNGKRMQDGSTANMIFGLKTLVSYISQFMRLLPGDVVTTGTPAGVGLGMKPPVFLKAGDIVDLEIEGLGHQRQKIVPFG